MRDSIVVLGPTASGKTKLAVQLAKNINGAILSIDSRQVFRGMDIGTGKDLHEYDNVQHHLIDILDAGEDINVYNFQSYFDKSFKRSLQAQQIPILVAGTPLYLDAILNGYQYTAIPNHPDRVVWGELTHHDLLQKWQEISYSTFNKLDTSTRKRTIRALEIATFLKENPSFEFPCFVKPTPFVFGLNPSVEHRTRQIDKRLEYRLSNGLVEEVQKLLDMGVSGSKLSFYGLEYKFVVAFLENRLSFLEMHNQLRIAIHQFAKRQMTFFRKMERQGLQIHWLDLDNPLEDLMIRYGQR